MALAPLCPFSGTPSTTHNQIGPSSAASRVGGFVYILGPCGSFQQTLLWGWEFLLLAPQPPQVFSIRALRLYFPKLEPWVVRSVAGSTSCCLSRQLQLCPPCSTIHHLTGSASRLLAASPLCPGCPSPPFLPVWMNVSSLSPWLLDFHTVRFSVSSRFLFLNCCPSFDCARRCSVSTYASIWAGSPKFSLVFKRWHF